MHLPDPAGARHAHLTRRQFFRKGALGVGGAALANLLGQGGALAADRGPLADLPHLAPKAKRVIYLLQSGAPSHVDLFDDKPALTQHRGEEIPDSVLGGQRLSTMTSGQARKAVLPPRAPVRPHGECGMWISDFLPHTASIADELCFVRSMHTKEVNHAPAVTYFLTGHNQPGRPSFGAWTTYGLGSPSDNLPGFVVMTSRDRENTCGQLFYDFYWGSGFLPSRYQGVNFRGSGDPVLYLSDPAGLGRPRRRAMLDALAEMNHLSHSEYADPEILTRISQYEMAYRMQASVPELTDLSNEPESVLALYGPDVHRKGSYAYNCLMARRLAERGVPFVQLMHAGWDQHQNLPTQLEIQCRDTDQPSAGLVKDLKMRGLLEDTLVIWGGEFGRTSFCQGDIDNQKTHGRDHSPYAFTLWMAGGGSKPGTIYGESDEFAYNVAKDPVSVHDFQATVLHLLGINHERLTFRYQGRKFRLTDVHGHVVRDLLV